MECGGKWGFGVIVKERNLILEIILNKINNN